MKIVIANSNPIYSHIESVCKTKYAAVAIHGKDELSLDHLTELGPDFVFFIHWSFIIPAAIHEKFNCVVFHMTDLPYGRGGSPLQNLIIRGHEDTVISAIKVKKGIDTGPVYIKRPLSLKGTAEQIFIRAGDVMLQMIGEIITQNPEPIEQQGEVVMFTRRTPEESNIQATQNIRSVYDFIRMLDAPGYPRAFIETDHLRFEFSGAEMGNDQVTANVKITKK